MKREVVDTPGPFAMAVLRNFRGEVYYKYGRKGGKVMAKEKIQNSIKSI